jgi:peptidoglycan/LPS O-acetylase OafA/YrhL
MKAAAPRVPDALAPPPGHPRFPLFDSLRGIAALSVLLVHTATFSGALSSSSFKRLLAHLDIGVTLFFVISGFLLYRPFVATRVLGAPAVALRDYGRRRFLRIAPGYWLALTALAIFPGIAGVFTGNWWVYYGLLSNYPVYSLSKDCAAEISRCGISPAWSLGIEVSFYVVLPFFALSVAALTRRLSGARWLGAELAILAIIGAISVPLVVRMDTQSARLLWDSPLGHGWWFGLGMALAAVSVRVQQTGTRPSVLHLSRNRSLIPWCLAAVLYVVSCLVLDPVPGFRASHFQDGMEYLAFGVIAALLLLPAVFDHESGGLPRKVLANRVLGRLGLISYGVFLWHWPVAYALYKGGAARWWPEMAFPLFTATTLAIAVVCASVSYYAVERPLMRFKSRRTSVRAAEPAVAS